MEAITYVNIFETKGLEYLLVISFLVGFLRLVRYVASEEGAGAEPEATARRPTEGTAVPVSRDAELGSPRRDTPTDASDPGGAATAERACMARSSPRRRRASGATPAPLDA